MAAVEGGLADLRRRIREELPRASAPPAVPVDDVMSSVLGAGSSSGTPESKVQRGQIDHALRRSVERLSPADRQLYRWYYSGGLTPKWIAPLVGVTPAQISRKLFKMRRRLVAILLQDKVIQSVIRQRTG